jgi:PAS domain S-box-containing protein
MAQRVRDHDWSTGTLGPIDQWPAHLRLAVDLCLKSRFPMRIWWGPDLIFIYNDAYAPILGKRHPDALGRPGPLVWPDAWPVVRPQVDAVMQRGEASWVERIDLTLERNGYPEDAWFNWSYSPIRDEAGQVGGLLCVCNEVTDQVRAERERDRLEMERERLSRIVEGERANLANIIGRAPAFICACHGPEHTFDLANDRYYELIARRDIIGKTVRQALPEIAGQGYFELLDTVYRTGEPHFGSESPVLLRRWGGDALDRRFINFVYQALYGADGHVSGIFVHGVDVTEMVESREALRESEQRYRGIVDQSVAGIAETDASGQFIIVNDRFCELTGHARSELLKLTLQEITHPEDLNRNADILDSVVNGDRSFQIEKRYVRPDQSLVWVHNNVSVLREPNGSMKGLVVVCIDITTRKQAEASREELLAQREHLLESERAVRIDLQRESKIKDEFLATLSHEIRTPLNAILGWSQIIRKSNDPEDLAQGLDTIERNARAQSQIVEDLLDMSRIISGKVRLDVQRLNLSAIVQAAVDTARPTADAKGVRLQSVIDPLHGATVSGDANRLQQIMWNLLSNAVKFTPRDGRVQVLLERVNSHVEISVIDTGEGIKPEFLPYVFDRFRQADASTTRRHGGLGLGLAIVKQLTELHGGSVRVKSAGPGLGTTFIVALPLTVVHPEPQPAPERRHPSAAPPSMSDCSALGVDITNVRVLVVDDEPDARALVKRLLEECDAQVTAAGSAAEAMRCMLEKNFDVIVSDIGMPLEDGYSLIRRIRALSKENGGNTPAIALTAYARVEDRVKAISAGFQLHVTKPVEPAELITMVASASGRIQPRS